MQEYVPLENMHAGFYCTVALQKFMKTYYGEECCNDKILWLNNKLNQTRAYSLS